jgi:hypothetical protein
MTREELDRLLQSLGGDSILQQEEVLDAFLRAARAPRASLLMRAALVVAILLATASVPAPPDPQAPEVPTATIAQAPIEGDDNPFYVPPLGAVVTDPFFLELEAKLIWMDHAPEILGGAESTAEVRGPLRLYDEPLRW